MATTLKELIEDIEKDDLPTNEFTIEDEDPMVILGKINEVIASLKMIQDTISSSDTKAQEALTTAIQSLETANKALSSSNVSLETANQAIATANQAIASANTALQESQNAVDTSTQANNTANTAETNALEALRVAQEALDQVVQGLGTKVYVNNSIQNRVDFTKDPQTQINDISTHIETFAPHTARQDHATSGVQVGWYQVANLKTQGNYDVKIKQAYNYNLPEAIHLSISINNRLSTVEPFASITQLSGVNPAAFALSKIRVRQGTDEGTTYLDVYNPDRLWNTTWVDITSDTQNVEVETNTPFEFIGTEDNPSGYKVSTLDLITGFNTSYLRANTATISGIVSNLNTISQPVNSVVTYSFSSGCANAPITDSGMVTQMQESTAYCTQLVIANDDIASTWRRSYRDGTWTEWTKAGTFLQYEYNKAVSFGESGYLYIGKFPIYDTNITVDISSTTSTTYSGKLVIACQNYVALKASVFGDYSNTVTPNINYKVVDNTVEIYFTPQPWSKNVIHITGCSIRGEVTHVCEKISAIPTDATTHPENEFINKVGYEKGTYQNGDDMVYYEKYNDGRLIYKFRGNTKYGNYFLTFPTPFIDNNYSISLSAKDIGYCYYTSITDNTKIQISSSNYNDFSCLLMGYWK